MTKPIMLDTFCKAGGCTKGYQQAGFYVIGIDIEPQPHYCGDEFIQGDALALLAELLEGRPIGPRALILSDIDAIHASPVCKRFSKLNAIHKRDYPDFITPLRPILQSIGKPWVIENVPGAPLNNPVMLCGTMFTDLRVIRHREFETWPPIYFPPGQCNHWGTCSGNAAWKENGRVTPSLKLYDFLTITGNDYIAEDGRKAMGIDWMTKAELSQAIPWRYTEWIGRQLIEVLA